jgi:class 3 adenylate cyclase
VGIYRDLAARIPGATAIELAPADFPPWAQDTEAAVNALRGFAQQLHEEAAELDRVLATVLFTDIVDSTVTAATMGDAKWRHLVGDHDRLSRALVSRYRGTYVKSTGDGMLATFDGPARAVRCAQALVEAVTPLGIEIRSGAHTGEITYRGDDIAGLGVHVAARVAALAGASEVVVSSTVKDLTAGSGLVFGDAGEHELKGVPDTWHLYRVVPA